VLDVLIAGGQIIDGSGNIAFLGALGIAGETVHILRGDVLAVEAARVVDASGRSVLGELTLYALRWIKGNRLQPAHEHVITVMLHWWESQLAGRVWHG
jgi:N-acyl-D-aspartate/D-glutamate deacylase